MDAYRITAEDISSYENYLRENEYASGSIEEYLRGIRRLTGWLEGRPADRNGVAAWKESLIAAGYAPVTINAMLAAVNGFFRYAGREDCRVRELRIQKRVFRDGERELEKEEYLRLLAAAASNGQERLALLTPGNYGADFIASLLPDCRIRPVMVENVHIVHMHPLQALVDTGDQVLAAAVVPVGAGPHIVSRLGGQEQLVPVGMPVRVHVQAEVPLRLPVGRAVIVRQVEVGDAQVEGCQQQRALVREGRQAAKKLPLRHCIRNGHVRRSVLALQVHSADEGGTHPVKARFFRSGGTSSFHIGFLPVHTWRVPPYMSVVRAVPRILLNSRALQKSIPAPSI